MIDATTETVLTLTEAAAEQAHGLNRRRPSAATVLRWIKQGVRGVRLEALRVGGRWLTSREALRRFTERLTAEWAERPAGQTAEAAPRNPVQITQC